jgi:hypothetical protein
MATVTVEAWRGKDAFITKKRRKFIPYNRPSQPREILLAKIPRVRYIAFAFSIRYVDNPLALREDNFKVGIDFPLRRRRLCRGRPGEPRASAFAYAKR